MSELYALFEARNIPDIYKQGKHSGRLDECTETILIAYLILKNSYESISTSINSRKINGRGSVTI